MFASRNDSKNNVLNWNDINENVIKHHLLIINCTPLGMFPNVDSKPDIPYSALTENTYWLTWSIIQMKLFFLS